jgi:hypothetical protein
MFLTNGKSLAAQDIVGNRSFVAARIPRDNKRGAELCRQSRGSRTAPIRRGSSAMACLKPADKSGYKGAFAENNGGSRVLSVRSGAYGGARRCGWRGVV